MRHDTHIPNPLLELLSRQKRVFVYVDGVCFKFNHSRMRHGTYVLETLARFERRN